MKKLSLIPLLGVVLAAAACSGGNRNPKQVSPIPVRTLTVGTSRDVADNEYVGVVEEELSAAVSFPVGGTIQHIYTSEGQRVNKGALLAELNSFTFSSAYTASKAMLDQAEDAMRRIQMLYENESIAEIKYIEMKTDLEKARSAEAIARKNLDDSRIYAPFSGVTGRRSAEAGENMLPNQTVLTLYKIDNVKIKVAVPEKEVGSVNVGQSATINVSALGGEPFPGSVTEKGMVADPVSHTYNIRITVENPEGRLLPGMVCNVSLAGEAGKSIITVPNRCVQKAPDGSSFVWMVSQGQAVQSPVTTGRQAAGGVEIVGGLSAGDRIVSEGYQKLVEGIKVEVL